MLLLSQNFKKLHTMIEKRKKDNNIVPIIAAGAGLLFLLSSSKSKRNNYTTNNNTGTNQQTDESNIVDQLSDYTFDQNNGVTSPVGTDIIPFVVPSSFVIEPIKNKFYRYGYTDQNTPNLKDKIYIDVAKISFLLCIYCPPTSLGSLRIEVVFFDDIQIVQYLDDQPHKWFNLAKLGTNNAIQLKEIANQMNGLDVKSGYNLFDISFYCYPNNGIPDDLVNYSFEAISIGLNIKYEETRLCSWRCLSAWNIKEDTLINEGSSLGTNTRFGVVRNKDSKPRDQRGLFSEWWANYVQSGYNTQITNISSIPVYNLGMEEQNI